MISSRRSSGFALVIVLGILVLVVAVSVGFLSRVSTERKAASSHRASLSARMLADNAVSLVQAQIGTATTQGSTVAWVSQPGMIRTFDAAGAGLQVYKLYSATNMISSSVGLSGGKSSDEPPATWSAAPAVWTDINAPVQRGSIRNFPILDPAATAEGFGITSAPGATTQQPAPMPVRWLYVLQDGAIVAPSGGSGDTATIAEETSANPIVGRIAFWTDDETCKVNINTSGEGTYWDVPRAGTSQELEFAQKPPWQKEFQRYPGHPAMTSLSTVFPPPDGYTDQGWAEKIFEIVPRLVGGGSNGGTVIPTSAAAALTPDSDRLYANIDELVFKPDRSDTGLTQTQVERAKFFLTAHSRGPETNLFNLPRIACWPIFNDLAVDRVTAFDRLIAFCASTGKAPDLRAYYFQRERNDDPAHDIGIERNTQLYAYLQNLTSRPIPGFGGQFSTKYGDDRDQILTEIFDYIRSTNLYDDTLAAGRQYTPDFLTPGHGFVAPAQYTPPGGSATMGFGRTFTLSELGIGFICNSQADDPSTSGTEESAGSNDPATNKVLGGIALNTGEKYIQAIIVPEFFCAAAGYTSILPDMRVEITGLSGLSITKGGSTYGLFPEVGANDSAIYTENPAASFGGSNWGSNAGWRYFGYNKGTPKRGGLDTDTVSATVKLYPFVGTPIKIASVGTSDTMTFNGGLIAVKLYSSAVGGKLLQTININLPSGTFPVPNLVTQSVTDGASGADLPKEAWWAFALSGAVTGKGGRLFYINRNPGTQTGTVNSGAFFLNTTTDVVRTVLPAHGDYRLVAAVHDVTSATYPVPANPGGAFYKHRYYDTASRFMASNLGNAFNSQVDQGYDRGGKYISTVTYPALFSLDIPSNASASLTPESTGDFDNCLPRALDGPFINKPDEGMAPTAESPYFNTTYSSTYLPGPTFFSPNRQIPSPGMFGSLPTGIKAGVPWRTLLFRKQPSHFGATSPADHLWLDLFWMPVVEPYAISDRFSTAGKINMNYQILPFTYIERSTGMRALLKAEKMAAIPNNVFAVTPNKYKHPGRIGESEFRFPIDRAETLSQFTSRFSAGNIFKSASEICDIDIVPQGQTAAGMSTFWGTNLATGHALTAENLRERIYTTLYPRLTTKSNTFTVHFQTQALKKVPTSSIGTWTEGKDQVAGEYRGSAIIERFIDANSPLIPDYAADAANGTMAEDASLDAFYKWRVISSRQFSP